MLNEQEQIGYYYGRRDRSFWNHLHACRDLRYILRTCGPGYVGNLFLLWLDVELADSAWDLVARSVSEVDAQIHNIP